MYYLSGKSFQITFYVRSVSKMILAKRKNINKIFILYKDVIFLIYNNFLIEYITSILRLLYAKTYELLLLEKRPKLSSTWRYDIIAPRK